MSGEETRRIATAIAGDLPPPGGARHGELTFAGSNCPGWVYFFAAPRSYTGDDLVEFHVPGNVLLARMLLDELIGAGARHAEAGEFTARRLFSGRLDLAEAEGVAATVCAHGEAELRAARQLLAGELSRRLAGPMELLTETLALVEAGIDFSDEDISFIATDELLRRVDQIDALLGDLVNESARFEPLTHEPTFVLVGRPNAGKSTLLNALAPSSRAIVSPVAGTTRDVLSAEVRLKRGLVRLLDVAGLDEKRDANDTIAQPDERAGDRAIEAADFVLLVRDTTDPRPPLEPPRSPSLVIASKADLSHEPDAISALTSEGLDRLRESTRCDSVWTVGIDVDARSERAASRRDRRSRAACPAPERSPAPPARN